MPQSDDGQAAAVAAYRAELQQRRLRLQSLLRETPGKSDKTWPVAKLMLRDVVEAVRLERLLIQHYPAP